MVVDVFPLAERDLDSVERLAGRAIPELLDVDPGTPLDLAVLIRPAGLDVLIADAPALDGQEEGKGKLCRSVCTLRMGKGNARVISPRKSRLESTCNRRYSRRTRSRVQSPMAVSWEAQS